MKLDPSIDVQCSEGVYEPAEDSYLMMGAVKISPGDRVLEVGCGTGIIALHCAKAGAKVTASDVSPEAVACTRANAKRNSLRLEVAVGDLLESIEGEFDLIIFNPPYLPRGAPEDRRWTGGETGIETALRFLVQCKEHLAAGGRALTIVSSLSGPRKFQEAAERIGYKQSIAARGHIFFEDMMVYEFSLATE